MQLPPRVESDQLARPFFGTVSIQVVFARISLDDVSSPLRLSIANRSARQGRKRSSSHRQKWNSRTYPRGFVYENNCFVEVYCQSRPDQCSVQRTRVVKSDEDGLTSWGELFEFEIEWPFTEPPPSLEFVLLHRGEYHDELLCEGELAFFLATERSYCDWKEWQVPLFLAADPDDASPVGELFVKSQWRHLFENVTSDWSYDLEDAALNTHTMAFRPLRPTTYAGLDHAPLDWELDSTAAMLEWDGSTRANQNVRGRTMQRFGRAHELWLAAMARERLRCENRMTRAMFSDAVRSIAPALPLEELDRLWLAAGGVSNTTTIGYAGFREAIECAI